MHRSPVIQPALIALDVLVIAETASPPGEWNWLGFGLRSPLFWAGAIAYVGLPLHLLTWAWLHNPTSDSMRPLKRLDDQALGYALSLALVLVLAAAVLGAVAAAVVVMCYVAIAAMVGDGYQKPPCGSCGKVH